MEGTPNGSENKKGSSDEGPQQAYAPGNDQGFQGTEGSQDYGHRSSGQSRTANRSGKFTKVIFNQIGGKECRRFAAMTWKERDGFMAKPEHAVVQERYEAHMASLESKA